MGEVIYPTLIVDWEARVPRLPLFIIGKLRKLDPSTYHFFKPVSVPKHKPATTCY
jgi:hypothetical protein